MSGFVKCAIMCLGILLAISGIGCSTIANYVRPSQRGYTHQNYSQPSPAYFTQSDREERARAQRTLDWAERELQSIEREVDAWNRKSNSVKRRARDAGIGPR